MGKKIKKLLKAAVGTSAAWALAVKPRISNKPDLSEIRRYDFANRGYHNGHEGIPENSRAAFTAAVEHGYGIVMDVRLSRDGIPVIFQDHKLERICGKEAAVEESAWKVLKECRLLETEETIPCLADGLELVDSQVPVLLNLHVDQNNYSALCAKVCEILDAYEGVAAVESFDYRVVKWFKENSPAVIRGQMLERYKEGRGAELDPLQKFVRSNLLTNFLSAPDFISCNIADRRAASLLFCRLLYRVQTMDWIVCNMDDYELVKTDESIVIFEQIEP